MEPAEPPSDGIFFIILILLLFCSIFFSASETAIISSNKIRIKYLKEKKNKAAARVERILQKKEFFLNAVLVGNNIVNIASSALITAISIRYFGNAGVGIATAVATVIILIFGEILPKSIALLRPEKIALRFSLPLTLFLFVTAPIVTVFLFITRKISRFFGIKKTKDKINVTEEDIKNLIEVGEEEGLIESEGSNMMHKILKYTDLTARDIMTPRTDLVTISIHTTRKEIFSLSHSSSFSRFPVCGDDIDDIRGILYIKDFLFTSDSSEDFFSIQKLLRPALFVFETQKMTTLQEMLRNTNQNIAVIIDEYGGTAGIVTVENLIESIFGGISDEYDHIEKQNVCNEITRLQSTNTWLIDGSERLYEINEHFRIQLDSKFYDTIAGFIIEKTGQMPKVGDSISEQNYRFTIHSVTGNRIEEIRIDLLGAVK